QEPNRLQCLSRKACPLDHHLPGMRDKKDGADTHVTTAIRKGALCVCQFQYVSMSVRQSDTQDDDDGGGDGDDSSCIPYPTRVVYVGRGGGRRMTRDVVLVLSERGLTVRVG
ncbi:hypothetical protein Vafri_12960, partial [Volvox africanus]